MQMEIEADSAGLTPDAIQILEPSQIECADIIFVMEAKHKSKINQKHSKLLAEKKIIILGIPHYYEFMQSELISILEKKLSQFFKIEKPKLKK